MAANPQQFQQEPLRIPPTWTPQERAFARQISDALEEVSAKFGRITGKDVVDGAITEVKLADSAREALRVQFLEAFAARLQYLITNNLVTDELYAAVADVATAKIGTAYIDWSRIKDLVSDRQIFTSGVGNKLYVADLAVTEANMVSLTVGELIVRGADGLFYAVSVDSEGEITTTLKQVSDGDIEDESITGSTKIISGSVTADRLNATDIFADNATIRQLMAANLDVDTFFAREAVINSLTLDRLTPLNDAITIKLNDVDDQITELEDANKKSDSYIQMGKIKLPGGGEVDGIAVGQNVNTFNDDGTISSVDKSMTVQSAHGYAIISGNQTLGEFDATGLETESVKVDRVEIAQKFNWMLSQSGGLILKKGG